MLYAKDIKKGKYRTTQFSTNVLSQTRHVFYVNEACYLISKYSYSQKVSDTSWNLGGILKNNDTPHCKTLKKCYIVLKNAEASQKSLQPISCHWSLSVHPEVKKKPTKNNHTHT